MFLSSSSQHATTALWCSRLLSRTKMMHDATNNGIACDGVCAQLCPSVLLPAEVTGAAVADASGADASVEQIASLFSVISSARSILCQNHCGRRVQAPYGAFFVAYYVYASTCFGGFYYVKNYIS